MKKGDKVWYYTNATKGIVEGTIKSIGSKYIILKETAKDVKFDAQTLNQVNSCGSGGKIIEDIEKYNEVQYYHKLEKKIKSFIRNDTLTKKQLIAIAEILNIN